jgi:hypothetical protein
MRTLCDGARDVPVDSRSRLQRRGAAADDVGMQGTTRIEHRRRERRGERTLIVRVIEYPAAAPKPARPASSRPRTSSSG